MPKPSRLALIIGIDNYISGDLERLPSCKKDALDLSALLSKNGFENYESSPIIGSEIINDEYGWAKMHETIIHFFHDAKPSQTILFYFSGHGIPGRNDVFLTTPHVDPKKPRARGFSLSELTKCMGSSKSKRVVGIIDACYSGSADLPSSALKKKSARQTAKQALATYDKIWKKTPKTKGTSLLLSSQSFEPSIAVEGYNSLYTKYLLEGLKGVKDRKDENGTLIPGSVDKYGNVTPDSLHDYVYYKVASVAEQVPEIKSDKSSKIVLAIHPQLGELAKESISLPKALRLDNGVSPPSEIAQKASKIKQTCERFFELRKTFSETRKRKDDVLIKEIEKTGRVLRTLYSKSEGINARFNLLTRQFEQGRIERQSYLKELSGLTEAIAEIEFKVNESVNIELEKLERQLTTSHQVVGGLFTQSALEQEMKPEVTEEEKEKVKALEQSIAEIPEDLKLASLGKRPSTRKIRGKILGISRARALEHFADKCADTIYLLNSFIEDPSLTNDRKAWKGFREFIVIVEQTSSEYETEDEYDKLIEIRNTLAILRRKRNEYRSAGLDDLTDKTERVIQGNYGKSIRIIKEIQEKLPQLGD